MLRNVYKEKMMDSSAFAFIKSILGMFVVKKSCCSMEDEHQGGVDAALLEAVWFCSPTNER
jgi:hypothetical protein